jgi:hypothetical protein
VTEWVDTGTGARKNLRNMKYRDLVMLKETNLKTRRPSKKLDNKLHGLFQVEKVITPDGNPGDPAKVMGIHNVFHVNLLET